MEHDYYHYHYYATTSCLEELGPGVDVPVIGKRYEDDHFLSPYHHIDTTPAPSTSGVMITYGPLKDVQCSWTDCESTHLMWKKRYLRVLICEGNGRGDECDYQVSHIPS